MDMPTDNTKPLHVTVRPKVGVDAGSFASRAARLFHDDSRIAAEPSGGELALSCTWYFDLEYAHARLCEALPGEYLWSEPRIEYRSDRVNINGTWCHVVLEPILRVEVHTPPEHVGTVIGDLSSRRGWVKSQQEKAGMITIGAEVPLSELSDYIPKLTESTEGKASATATFLKYDVRPSYLDPPPDEPMAAALRA